MSMEITNNYTTSNTKESRITTSTVELKTSTPGVTRTEEIKTGFCDVNEYSKYLQDKYRYMNTGTTSMEGVPTTVSVSGAFLKRCMNDPEKAKYLEENLAAIPDCAKMAVNGCLGTLTSLSYQIDANGNISIAISGTNDPDGKIARENAKRKAQEKRESEERAIKRRKEKKAEEEKAAKRRAERNRLAERLEDDREEETFTLSAAGTDIKSVTRCLIATASGTSTCASTSFDIKA